MEKVLKAIMVLVIIVLVGIILVTVDYSRIQHQGKPIFSIQNPAGVYKDGGTVEYFGLGYKIIDFNRISGYTETKIGTWFMQYEDFEDEYKEFEKDVIISDFPEEVRARVEGEVIIYTGSYGAFINPNIVTGKFIDIYGNIYNYKIPSDENGDMQVPVARIDEKVLKKYKTDYISTLGKENLEVILNNMNNISDEYEKRWVPITGGTSSFVYIIVDGDKKVLKKTSGGDMTSAKENISEAGKKILDVIFEK